MPHKLVEKKKTILTLGVFTLLEKVFDKLFQERRRKEEEEEARRKEKSGRKLQMARLGTVVIGFSSSKDKRD